MNWKGSGHGPIKVICWHMPGRNEEIHEKPVRIGNVLDEISVKNPMIITP
jgi:hypothetical protein